VPGRSSEQSCWDGNVRFRLPVRRSKGWGPVERDYELEAWARSTVLGSRRPSPYAAVKAYRILAKTGPRAYRAELGRALVQLSHEDGYGPEERLALLEEAVTAIRLVPEGDRRRAEHMIYVLDWHQRCLVELGRRADARPVWAELAAISRAAMAAGQRGWVEAGLRTFAHTQAEDGHHTDAVTALQELVAADEPDSGGGLWDRLCLIAELGADGRGEAAATTLAELVEEQRASLRRNMVSMSDGFHTLNWYAVLTDRGGRPNQAQDARREAADLVRRLARSGEPSGWSGAQFNVVSILLAVQTSDEEPAADVPRPVFGADMGQWSRDVRTRYLDEMGGPLCGSDTVDEKSLLRQAIARERRIPEGARLLRRLAIRTAVYRLWRCGHTFFDPTIPALHDSVAAARRAYGESEAVGRLLLARALTDRATVYVAGHRYTEALADYQEALPLFVPG
jgi:hypothetical protein